MAVEKLLPQNVEAEAGVLGSILIDPEAIVQVAPFLKPDDFYRNQHRDIYEVALDLYESGQPADFITLCDELERRGKLETVGGTAYIGSLANQVPTSRNLLHYAGIVERTAINRRLIHAAGQMAGVAYADPDADAAIEQAIKLVLDVQRRRGERDFVTLSAAIDEVFDEWLTAMESGRAPGLRTLLAGLDRHTGGFLPGEIIYGVGRPGMGKSLLGSTIAEGVAEDLEATDPAAPGTVAWFTMEMDRKQLAKRLIAKHSGINSRFLRAGFVRPDGTPDRERAKAAMAAGRALAERIGRRILLRDTSLSVEQMGALLAREVAEHGTRLAVVDYFSLIKREGGTGKEGRTERMTEVSNRLMEIGRDLRVPILVLAQMNREFAGRGNPRPVLTDIRETGATEQDAHWVIAVHRPAYYDAQRAATDSMFAQFGELLVLKARDGKAGVTIPVRVQEETQDLSDWPQDWAWPEDETRKGAQEG